jgi:hypothetical protein
LERRFDMREVLYYIMVLAYGPARATSGADRTREKVVMRAKRDSCNNTRWRAPRPTSVLLELAAEDEHALAIRRRAELLHARCALELRRGPALREHDEHLEAVADLCAASAGGPGGGGADEAYLDVTLGCAGK